jgi:ryanodine receptor 2
MPIMDYTPNLQDTADVRLRGDIMALAELLAENAHEVWARGRAAESWIYGPSRDDVQKLHPCLVPYSELPDSEKAYDRNAAIETLKWIVSLGYSITPNSDS